MLPADHRVKIKDSEKRDKYLKFAREQKIWNMEVTVIPIVVGALGTSSKGLVKRTGKLGNKRTRGDHPDYSIIKIGQNTMKNPEGLKRLAVTQTPVKNHQLTLVWKNLKGVNNCNGNLPRYVWTLPTINSSKHCSEASRQPWQSNRIVSMVTLSFVYVVLLFLLIYFFNSILPLGLYFWPLTRPQQQ